MLTARDALTKTLAKSQKVTFWSQKNGFGCFFFYSLLWMLLDDFFLLTAEDALSISKILDK